MWSEVCGCILRLKSLEMGGAGRGACRVRGLEVQGLSGVFADGVECVEGNQMRVKMEQQSVRTTSKNKN